VCNGLGACSAPACTGTLGLPGVPTPRVAGDPIALAAADLSGDGKIDLAVVNSSFGSVSVLIALGHGIYAPPVSYATGAHPTSVVAVDLDGDGKLDLAVASTGVALLFNQGNGVFAAPVLYSAATSTTAATSSIVTADLDGDGSPDLAVGGGLVTSVSVLLNHGNGTFATTAYYPTGAEVTAIAAGDLDGDGAPELVVGHRFFGGQLSVLPNHGDGTFAAASHYPAEQAGAIAIADLDADGKQDLIVTGYAFSITPDNVSVMINQGNSAFAPAVIYPIAGSQAFLDPACIVAVDLDGDGQADLAIADEGGSVGVLKNQGSGTFGAPVSYATGTFTFSLAAADLNNDGKPDLIAGNKFTNTVSVLLNQGNGTLAAAVDYGWAPFPMVGAADLNNDGRIDLFTPYAVLLNNGCLP